jgi:large subunit ribosomal protein L32e
MVSIMAEQKKTKTKKVLIKKRWHPKFARMNYGRTSRSRIGEAWRRPRGHDNKQKTGIRFAPDVPCIGFRQPRAIRGMHPTGVRPVLVHNMAEAMAAKEAIVLSATIGGKKRAEIVKAIRARNIRMMNE